MNLPSGKVAALDLALMHADETYAPYLSDVALDQCRHITLFTGIGEDRGS